MTQNWNTLKWKVSVFVANRPSFTKNNEEISKFLKAKGKWSPTEAWFHNEEHYVVNSVSMHNIISGLLYKVVSIRFFLNFIYF